MEEVQALTENLSFVVSFDPEPLTRMEGTQSPTKSPVDFVVGEKFPHGRVIHSRSSRRFGWPIERRSSEPSDSNILSSYRAVAFVDLTREPRPWAFARKKFETTPSPRLAFCPRLRHARGHLRSTTPSLAEPGQHSLLP
jgi:hypothetical protein